MHRTTASPSRPEPAAHPVVAALTRRGFLRGTALAGGGRVAATIAACSAAGAPAWSYTRVGSTPSGGPSTSPATSAPPTPLPTPTPSATHAMTPPPNAMDGVPFITQDPILRGGTFVYEFEATPSGSHMYHSHHNATDQVGRGLLGAWISDDSLGGFTINGKGFPATVPIVAQLGERVRIRFMNEGVMMHPWHLHGMPMRVVARDGYPLGGAAFTCDTLGVNPGERWDVIVDCRNPGTWAFHCHILPHAEGRDGMFGMVNALVVQ